MKVEKILDHVLIRHLLGLLSLVLVHFIADQDSFVQRTGFSRISPYFFLILMYGWIVFHNRVLFEKLFMHGKRASYFTWTGLAMLGCSLNMHYIITTGFHVKSSFPHIVSFWIYTIAGLGVYVVWHHLRDGKRKTETTGPAVSSEIRELTFHIDGTQKTIALESIYYIESLENYIRIIAGGKPLVVRMSLREAEERLPKPQFIRISRSCIVNSHHIQANNIETVVIHGQELKVGKVYKRYVAEFLK